MAAKSLQLCLTLCDPIDSSPPGSPVPGILQQEHWSGLPFPSPMHKNEKWKWSHSVMSDSCRLHGLQPTRLLCPWDFPGKSTGVWCHHLLHSLWLEQRKMAQGLLSLLFNERTVQVEIYPCSVTWKASDWFCLVHAMLGVCVCVCVCVCVYFCANIVNVIQSHLTLCNPVDCRPPASSVHRIIPVRTLGWVGISSSRGSSWPRDWTWISRVSCTAGNAAIINMKALMWA